jgi:hypothetical protein
MASTPNLPKAKVLPADSGINSLPHFGGTHFVYNYQNLDADNWDKYRPFQFVLVQATENGYKAIPNWRFTLPIPPQEMTVSMPTADTVTPTLTGYTEIHGGAPFRMISLQGTMGVNPGRPAQNSLFNGGGTLTRAVIAQARSVRGSALSTFADAPRIKNDYDGVSGISPNTPPFQDTGFIKWHQFRQFIEGYMEIKKMVKIPSTDSAGDPILMNLQGINPRDIRLAFCVWKDAAVYLVTLRQADLRRSASNPLEYQYSISMQAFKRINLDMTGSTMDERVTYVRRPNIVNDVLNRMQAARDIIRNTKRLLNTGLLGPLSIIGEVARQLIGIARDTIGLVRTIAEMPATFARQCIGIIRESRAGLKGIGNEVAKFAQLDKIYNSLGEEAKEALGLLEATVSIAPPSVATFALEATSAPNDMSKKTAVTATSGPVNEADDPSAADPRDFDEFSKVTADVAAASEALQAQLASEIERSRNITLSEVEALRDQLLEASDYFATLVGSWSQTYQDTYDLPTPDTPQREPSQEELDVLNAINELAMAADKFVVYMQDQGNKIAPTPTSLEYVAGLAQASGIAFTVPTSKFAVPFPFGASLESLAVEYLGDANRWHEIATLNGLRAPYVDELGFQLPLLVNGNGNIVSVSDASNLFLKQTVWLSSNTKSRVKRRILAIDKMGSENYLITLDGEANLGDFKTVNSAVLESFLPGTVNSRQVIYLPTDALPDDPEDVESIPGIDIFDPLLKVAGVDWLLNDKMDLVVTEYGDNPLSYGMRNVIQTVQIGLSTVKGALKQHPNWGLGIKAGISNADIDAKDVIDSVRDFINADPTFSGLRSANLTIQGNAMWLNIDVGVTNYLKSVPMRFPLKA